MESSDLVPPFERSQRGTRQQLPSPDPNGTEKRSAVERGEREKISAKWQRYATNVTDAEN